MTYTLWTEKSIDEIKHEMETQLHNYGKENMSSIIDLVVSIIEEANTRHNDAMLNKDIEYLKEKR